MLQIYYTTTMSRWFNIYFPEYKTVYGKPDAKSGILIVKKAPLPEDILTLGIDGVNEIWRDEKVRAVGKARAKTLIEAAEHSVGNKEGAVSARMEIRMLLEDYESRNERLQEVMTLIDELVKQIPMAEKLLEIKGVGMRTVSGFLAEVGDTNRFKTPKVEETKVSSLRGSNVTYSEESIVQGITCLLHNQKVKSVEEYAVTYGSCSETRACLLCYADKRCRL